MAACEGGLVRHPPGSVMSEIDEAELLGAGRSGTVANAAIDGEKRTVQAALLRRCCYELKDQIDPRGLRLTNAIVVGCLDLAGLSARLQWRPAPLRRSGARSLFRVGAIQGSVAANTHPRGARSGAALETEHGLDLVGQQAHRDVFDDPERQPGKLFRR